MRSSENSDLLHHTSFETAGALQAAQVLVGVVSEIGSPIVVSEILETMTSLRSRSLRGSHAASEDLMPPPRISCPMLPKKNKPHHNVQDSRFSFYCVLLSNLKAAFLLTFRDTHSGYLSSCYVTRKKKKHVNDVKYVIKF